MKQQKFKLAMLFVAFTFSLGIPSMALDSTMESSFHYQTFKLPQTFLQSKLFKSAKKSSNPNSSLLFVARSSEGILYAGNQELGYCANYEKSQTKEFEALTNGTLKCKNLSLKVENGVITEVFDAKMSQKLNLKPLESFTLQSQEVLYQYPKKSKSNSDTHAEVSMQFYCSSDSKIQQSLEVLYDTKFNCKNAQKVFLNQAQDSLWEAFKEMQENTNVKSKKEAIEEFLKTASFEMFNRSTLEYFDENLLVFDIGDYTYWGGAHGISSKSGVIISRKDNKILKLESMIDFKNPKLKNLLWEAYQNYQKTLEYPMDSYVLFEDFEASRVVLLDYDSFIFIYQPYEIMPYAYGVIKLRIPLEQMAEFVQFAKTPLESLFVK